MTLLQKLIVLDRRLSMRAPKTPVRVPTEAERRLKDALNRDVRNHARRIAESVGVYPS